MITRKKIYNSGDMYLRIIIPSSRLANSAARVINFFHRRLHEIAALLSFTKIDTHPSVNHNNEALLKVLHVSNDLINLKSQKKLSFERLISKLKYSSF